MRKQCSKCKKTKLPTEYYKDKRTNDGLYSGCKSCHSVYLKEYHRKWSKRPANKIHTNITREIRRSLKGRKAGRSWEKLVGYSLDDLMRHLENQFESWMTWENHGKWHIDHIKPRSLFKYKTAKDPEFKKCWALDNLQPLERIENLKKGNKLTTAI